MGCCCNNPNIKIPETNRLKHTPIDLSSNPNKYITENKNYYKNQIPTNNKFTDELFPNNPEIIFGKINGKYTDPNIERRNEKLKNLTFKEDEIEFKRAREIWGKNCKIFNSTIKSNDISKGPFSNSYFISSLCAMSQYPQLILQLFKTINLPIEEKEIEIGMKIDGQWKIVCINDYFPVFKKNGQPIFSNAPNKAIWGVLLEKAWAKVNGGYSNIFNGNSKDVFETFTPFSTIEIDNFDNKYNEKDKFKLWKNIKDSNDNNCIITCTIKDNKSDVVNFGLEYNCTYCVIDCEECIINNENVKLIKLKSPFGECNWNGDWSYQSKKWNDKSKNTFKIYDENKKSEGIFYMEYNDFIKYFQINTFCIPLTSIKSSSFKVSKENAKLFNVIKIKILSKGIITFSIIKKNSIFHKKIEPGKLPSENILLVKIEYNKLKYIESSFNQPLTTNLYEGEYICLYYVDYESINSQIRKYTVDISSCVDFKFKEMNPDKDLSLLKSILLQNVEDIPKYNNRLNNPLILFSGNKFWNNSFTFVYLRNQSGEDIHFQIKIDFTNIRSLEGNLPSNILLKNKEKFIFTGIKKEIKEKSKCGISGTSTEKANKGEIIFKLNESVVDSYLNDTKYDDLKVSYEFSQI